MLAEVEPTQERMTYSVASRKHHAKRYKVDLLFNSGAGKCSCRDFEIRRQSNLDDGAEALSMDTTCYHLRRAQRHFLYELLKEMARSEES